ncbi:MAG: carbohydrate kinase family protein [Candidatus Paceibacterota bacterium]
MFDVITFGSATQDIFIKSKKFLPALSKTFATGKGVYLEYGSKIEVEDIILASGGGGTNSAAVLTKLGLKVAYCGIVGNDYLGNLVIKELDKFKVNTDFVKRTGKKPTNISVFLTYPKKDRTALVYRGASDLLSKKDIPWQKIKNAKWFYLGPFAGKLASLTESLVNFAKKNNIRVALNPGYNQLTLPQPVLKRILAKVDILILNKEEACLLTKISYKKERKIFEKLDKLVSGICIMTKGGQGVVVSDGTYLYRAPSLGLKAVDKTGAGDSFGASFVAGIMERDDITYAIQLGMANSAYNIAKFGAKEGILRKGQSWPKVKVSKGLCSI